MLGQLQFRGWGRKVYKVSFPSSEGGEEKLRRFPSHHPTFYCRENTLLIHGVPWSQHFHFGGRRFKFFFFNKSIVILTTVTTILLDFKNSKRSFSSWGFFLKSCINWVMVKSQKETLSAGENLTVLAIAGFGASRFPSSAPADISAACYNSQSVQSRTAHHRNASLLQCHSIRSTE